MKTTNPKDYIVLLGVFSIALTNGLLDKDEVSKWADNIISSDNEPDYFIIELSLCGHKSINDIVSLLNEFIGQRRPLIASRVILGFLYRQYTSGQITLRKVIDAISWIVWEDNLTEQEKGFMYGLDEDYNCAEDGIYGTIEAVKSQTLSFLEIYKDFQIDNFKDWSVIDNTIDEKIKVLSEIVKKRNEEFIKAQRVLTKRKWWKIW